MTTLLRTVSVSRRFGDLLAVDDVSFAVEPGEVVGLLGANGAGKSTLIRMILGLIAPSSGRIEVFGEAPSRSSRARLGYVPQGLGLYPDLTVAENLSFVASAFGAPVPDLGDLAPVADSRIDDVSLGVRRRVAFAAALSHRPELLLLDEPTSGVGPIGRAELWNTIGESAADGAGILVSTHYMDEAEQCDRLVMLAAGRLIATGTAAGITSRVKSVEIAATDWVAALTALDDAGMHPSLVGTRLRVTDQPVAEVRALLRRADIQGSVEEVAAGFEEAFVALAGA